MSEATQFPQLLQTCQNSLDQSMKLFGKLVKYVNHEDEDEMKMKLLETIQSCNKTLEKFTETLFKKPKIKRLKKRSFESSKTSVQVPVKKLKPSPSPLMDLPNEIWMKILNYLPTYDILKNFNLTCKHFHSLAINPCAIKSLKLKKVNDGDHYQKLISVLKRSKTLNELTIENCGRNMNPILAHTLRSNFLNTLQVLGFEATLSKYNLEYMKNSNIQVLKLDDINLNDDAMKQIGALKNLKSVRISTIRNTHPVEISEFIKALVDNKTRIEDLTLQSFSGEIRINALTLRNFLEQKTESLKKLKVCCYVTKEDKSNNNKVIWNASPNLEKLDIHDMYHLSNRTFKVEFGLDMPKLTKLALVNIEGGMLRVFGAQNFPLLERLQLRRESGGDPPERQHIYDILENCPNLKSVKLAQFQVSDPQPALEWHIFMHEVYKKFNVYIDMLNSNPMRIFEEYLKKTDLATFYKYTKLKAKYFDWLKEEEQLGDYW